MLAEPRETEAGKIVDKQQLHVATLMTAAKTGDTARVCQALDSGTDPNAIDPHRSECRRTALFHAVREGHLDVVAMLLSAGADPNAAERGKLMGADGRVVLHYAAENGNTEIADAIIGAGADVNAADEYGTTPLILACGQGNAAIIGALVRAGARVDARGGEEPRTPMLAALAAGCAESAWLLLESGATVDADVLVAAAHHGQTRIVGAALDAGVPVDARAAVGEDDDDHYEEAFGDDWESVENARTPLIAAADLHLSILEQDPSIDVKGALDDHRWLSIAEKVRIRTMQLLLEAGPDVNARDKYGRTALVARSRRRR